MRKTPARSRTIVRVWPGPRKGPTTDRANGRASRGRIDNDSPDQRPDVNPIPINPDPDGPNPEQFFWKPDNPRLLPPHGVSNGI